MEELKAGIRRVTVALPVRPGHVHCYLLPVDDGFVLVDTGLGLPDATEHWAATLAALPGPVTAVFVTHFHPDHVGAAQDVRDLTGAPVLQGRLDAEQARLVWQDEGWSEVLADWFHRNGVPPEVTDELLGQGRLYKPFIRSVPDPLPVGPGDTVHGWEVVAAPGHADGQLTLLKDGILIAADHVLDPISPAVGLWPESSTDPLGEFLDALRHTIALAPTIAYAGHGEAIADPVERARQLIRHHDERLRLAEAALGPEPRTGYEVSFPLFGDDLKPASRRFAVAETLSHLARLVAEGRAVRHEGVETVSYTAP